jgi:hypothetical protein
MRRDILALGLGVKRQHPELVRLVPYEVDDPVAYIQQGRDLCRDRRILGKGPDVLRLSADRPA